jgi:hypothetical protein
MRSLVCLCAIMLPVTSGQATGTAMMLTGRGVQIYTCAAQGGQTAWRLKAPDADLFDAQGHLAGHHSAGPSWRAADGSTVTGEKLVDSAAPAPGAVPWLVLHAKSHSGSGVFTGVSTITRSQTEGGAAPKTGCDSAHKGAETRIPYSAIYTFF